jgi:hypothetical protein
MKNYIKLTKVKSTEWKGNGMGTDSAEWVVKGNEHISVLQVGGRWIAKDTTIRNADGFSQVIARADYKHDLVLTLNRMYITEGITKA